MSPEDSQKPGGTFPPSPIPRELAEITPAEETQTILRKALSEFSPAEAKAIKRYLLMEFLYIREQALKNQAKAQRKMAKQRADINRLRNCIAQLRETLHDRNETIRKTRESLIEKEVTLNCVAVSYT